MSLQVVAATCCAGVLMAAHVLAAPAPGRQVSAKLVAETTALVPGRNTWLGLRLTHEPHWHTYWINPGDSGLATKLTWTLPANYLVGEIAWPAPQRFALGGLFNFGFDGDTLLPVRLSVPADARPGSTVHLAAEAHWLVCRQTCIPGKAVVTLDLPVAANASVDAQSQAAFAAARAAQPRPGPWKGEAHVLADVIEVTLRAAKLPSLRRPPMFGTPARPGGELPSAAADAFVLQSQIASSAPPRVVSGAGSLTLTFAKSDYFSATPAALDLLLIDEDARAWSVRAPFTVSHAPAP